MNRGEVWLINLDPTVGAEIKKTRPAVIVSVDAVGILPLPEPASLLALSAGLLVCLRRRRVH